MRDAIDWLESRVGTRRGGATVFAVALLVFGLRSIALPVIPGRDFGTYIGYYVQMWDWHSVVPMAMLFRTPLAPLVIGGTLDLFGGWGLLVVMALLFAASVVLWTRTALTFGPRAALVTAVALLVYPGYGILFHTPASEPVAAAAFAVWALALARAWIVPGVGRFAILGAATAATALARPAFEVLVLFAALPLVLRLLLAYATRMHGRVRRCRHRGAGLVDCPERPPLRRLRAFSCGSVPPVLPRLHDRPHRRPRKRPRIAGARRRGETGNC